MAVREGHPEKAQLPIISVRDCDGREGGVSVEGAISNRRHSVRDCDGCEGGASVEGGIANRSHSLCKSHFCKFMIATDALCSGVYCCFGKGRLPIIWVVIVTTIVITIVITIVASMAVICPM